MSSDAGVPKIARQGILFCLVGPTGSGKSSLASKLIESEAPQLRLSVSATSRPPRETESDGEDYHFLTREAFKEKITDGELFEWEETHGNYYGTLQETVDRTLLGEADLLLDIDIRGALTFKERYPEHTVIVFLVPPSFEELRRRITKRGAISEDEIQLRFQTAEAEYGIFLSAAEGKSGSAGIDYLVLNADFGRAFEEVRSILVAERSKVSRLDREHLLEMCRVNSRG